MPDPTMLAILAIFFDVSVDYLINDGAPRSTNSIRIPVIGNIAAGIPIEAIEDIYDYEEIPKEWVKDGSEFFGLKIKGGSMEPRIQEDDVVIVRKQEDVESGELAAVRINGQDVTVKKLVKHDSGISLVSYNAAYEPKFYTTDEVLSLPVEIIGKVVELRGKF
jgi:repressor LexA